ncbi:methyl-accepting chemotaxis protein [Oleiagrimonas sp. C23AA]|uniref:methyl-accepting chemotaxis protein n=1 Tax=Oleiagrimonas sp. C23AA TaxID=2719047 RepID=UPI00142053C4|nr:methyl-accepting chemotaxis protein [Oleiagrimonas sp. C23AA]NII09423.1 chemotaxis protein [Oleiagrimonas sp. C23AA]
MSMRGQLWLILGIIVLGMLGLSMVGAWHTRNLLLEERRSSLQYEIETASSLIKSEYAQVQAGKITEAQGKQRALDQIRTLRWDKGFGYVFIFNSTPVMLMHPVKPQLVGQNVGESKDPDGKLLFQEMVKMGQQHGSGFVDYKWPKPGAEKPQPKISYVEHFQPWDWFVGSGVYVEDVNASFYKSLWRHLTAAAIFGAVVLSIVAWIMRRIRRQMGAEPATAVALAQRVAGGHLERYDGPAPHQGSVMAALVQMQQRLVEVVSVVRSGSENVSEAAKQIAQGNDDLSQRTQHQASSLEQTAASMEEMTSTVKHNAENAGLARQLSQSASAQAEAGGSVMGEAMQAMQAIGESSKRINDIVTLINEVAFQTNLLALNAAVESARAGEHGRGFAVVASEVRQLAQRTAVAAKDIGALIKESSQRIEAGSGLVSRSGAMLDEIVGSVRRVTDIVAEIAAASEEQSDGINQVNTAVTSMDEATQQNAALVEQAAAASRAMQEQADELMHEMAFFHLPDDSARLSSAPVAPTPSTIAHVQKAAPKRVFKPSDSRELSTAESLATATSSQWEEF